MQSNERIREVWETTQENLETAVGTAYSGWQGFYVRQVEPFGHQVSSWLKVYCFCCFPANRKRPPNKRNNSVDIFFDMYDEDEAIGRDELERLLGSGAGRDWYNSEYYEEEQGGGGDDSGYSTEDTNGEGPSSDQRYKKKKAMEYPSSTDIDAYATYKKERKPSLTEPISSLWYSIFPFWGKSSIMKYKPSTADLIGVNPTMTNVKQKNTKQTHSRSRSDTKSSRTSTHSSATYRSRRDLFSDGESLDDAQIVSDNFASLIVSKEEDPPSSSARQEQR